MTKLKITIDELDKIVSVLLASCRQRGLQTIEIEPQLYWTVIPEEAFDFSTESPELGVGAIEDDVAALKHLIQNPSVAAGLHLNHLASILQYLGVRHPSLS